MKKRNTKAAEIATIGVDLGDKYHQYCALDAKGNKVREDRIPATARGLEKRFASMPRVRVAIEAGAHSFWVSHALEEWGHEALVANPRKLPAISKNIAKSDQNDAELLARIARVDPKLLAPIRHRGRRAQAHLAILRSRDALVRSRTALVNCARGLVKALGARLPSCSAAAFAKRVREELPEALRPALGPIVQTVEDLTARIKGFDKKIEKLSDDEYPETENLRSIRGVGPITSLTFVLTLESPERFVRSRRVPVYLGLVPRRDQSGDMDKQLRITKAGNKYLRRLLVSCAHYILSRHGEDCDLRRWGLKLCARGGKNAKKRAAVAVARKLAVHMHSLWKNGEVYDCFRAPAKGRRNSKRAA